METAKEREIRQATEAARVNDTLILQKINASHRVAFAEKFPGQCEHILRLLTERLQAGLDKRDAVIVDQPNTWKLSSEELMHLSQSIEAIYRVHRDLKGA